MTYREHDFFGEYQILFDLYSGAFYRTYIPGAVGATSQNQHEKKSDFNYQIIFLMIDREKFLSIICSENNYSSFKHYHDMSIKRYKNMSKLINLDKKFQREEDEPEKPQ